MVKQTDEFDGAGPTIDRRRFLAGSTATVVGITGLAGCIGSGSDDGNGGNGSDDGEANDPVGSDPEDVGFEGVSEEGTAWEDLPDLEGTLTIYSGRREAQIEPVLRDVEDYYDDLEVLIRYDDNEAHLSTILEEGQNSEADIFYTQDSGTLGALANEGRTVSLPDDVIETVPDAWSDPNGTWTGVSGRVRCIAYNTDAWDPEELPDDIFAYADDDRFQDDMGWRVDSGSFLSWVRALMVEHGEEFTREYLTDMEDAGVTHYEGGSTTPDAVANREVSIGFVNHYYVGRVMDDQPDAPINVTYTDGDLGSLFNVSGTAVLDSSDEQDLAADFVRHLLGAEGQRFFVETNREYAVIPGVEYDHEEVPRLEEISYPDFDLNQLADVEPAVDLLRDVGIR
ncbi:extracellular solute-binding protein [Natrarchaeobius oligotrophus]|uniref:Extracellular solute-binding protein n=1 Tax=Natrarchaeobius chitinivorans TaxID=1679083 RepID=A0A3N6MIA4_NATCH|nr:extracellular solute-binding protein [Natrarchaeobius chitinivorans]RQH00875.1 extracellular solute-binding protein [Natrarchaeobius chitinivorans]